MAKMWADQPIPLIPTPKFKLQGKPQPAAYVCGTEMANVHNTIIRALNAIILQAPNVKEPKDIEDFTIFCDATCFTIGEHHKTEETLMFPLFEKHSRKGIMDDNVVQHDEFHPGLHKLDTYIKQLKNGVAEYDGRQIATLVENFAEPLKRHLEDEVNTLCSLEEFDVPWAKIMERVTEHAKRTADVYLEIPWIMCCTDITFENGIHQGIWPPWPWIVLLVFRWRYFPKYKGAWRFGSCDQYGVPQELPFASVVPSR